MNILEINKSTKRCTFFEPVEDIKIIMKILDVNKN